MAHEFYSTDQSLQAECGGTSDEAAIPTDIAQFYGVDDIDMYTFPSSSNI